MTAEVKYNGGGSFTLTISDSTQGWPFSTNKSYRKAKLGSAEWIAEAPSSCTGVFGLGCSRAV